MGYSRPSEGRSRVRRNWPHFAYLGSLRQKLRLADKPTRPSSPQELFQRWDAQQWKIADIELKKDILDFHTRVPEHLPLKFILFLLLQVGK